MEIFISNHFTVFFTPNTRSVHEIGEGVVTTIRMFIVLGLL